MIRPKHMGMILMRGEVLVSFGGATRETSNM